MARKKMNEKQEATLGRMKETREIDAVNLRETIKAKLDWAKAEKRKGEGQIKTLVTQIETLKYQIARLDGIIIFIEDLLNPREANTTENKVEESKDQK
jgi:hypothetical protein